MPTMSPTLPARATVLDDVLPASRYRTTHARPVDADVDATAAAMRTTPLSDAGLARALLLARSLGGSRGYEGLTVGGLAEHAAAEGVVALGGGPHELAFGWVGQPWPGSPGIAEPLPTTAAAFAAFEAPDAVRVALSIRCGAASYGTLLVTETRIEPGPGAARPFARYWTVVRLGSGLVRRSLLKAIADRAEAGGA